MDYKYTWEKLHVAVLILAGGDDGIRERLADAYKSSLMRLEQDDFPADMRRDFKDLADNLTSVDPTGNEGKILASARAMTKEKAKDLAESIVSMYDKILRNLD